MKGKALGFFVVGCLLSVFTLGVVLWAFAIATLTDDQRALVRVLLPLSAGFVAGSFVGAFTVNGHGLIPGAVATATGGFGVWLILFMLWPRHDKAFSIVIRPREHDRPGIACVSGTMSIDLGGDRRTESVSTKGEARFEGIPSSLEGARVTPVLECKGYSTPGDATAITLSPGSSYYVLIKRDMSARQNTIAHSEEEDKRAVIDDADIVCDEDTTRVPSQIVADMIRAMVSLDAGQHVFIEMVNSGDCESDDFRDKAIQIYNDVRQMRKCVDATPELLENALDDYRQFLLDLDERIKLIRPYATWTVGGSAAPCSTEFAKAYSRLHVRLSELEYCFQRFLSDKTPASPVGKCPDYLPTKQARPKPAPRYRWTRLTGLKNEQVVVGTCEASDAKTEPIVCDEAHLGVEVLIGSGLEYKDDSTQPQGTYAELSQDRTRITLTGWGRCGNDEPVERSVSAWKCERAR